MTFSELLVCPGCRSQLEGRPDSLRCVGCAQVFPVEDGIPVLISSSDDKLHQGADHKLTQAGFFDEEVDEEFEILRPFNSPQLYGWLLNEKFNRSISGIESLFPGVAALSVCGGSGMDAEFLARAGARVIVCDISLGAMKRAKERARRRDFALFPVVADVESLPFADRSIDLAYVHDGLHHLENPMSGLQEMTRVASRAVSVTEPAKAAATKIAVRLGASVEVEEAGNVVARMTLNDIIKHLTAAGFGVRCAERYAMFYRHEPRLASRLLSRPGLFPVARATWKFGNSVIGRFGNKLVTTALRAESALAGQGEASSSTADEQVTR